MIEGVTNNAFGVEGEFASESASAKDVVETVDKVLGLADLEGGCYDAGTEEVLTQMYDSLSIILNSGEDRNAVLAPWKARLMTSRMIKPPEGQTNFDTVGFTVVVGESSRLKKAVKELLGRGPSHQTHDGVSIYNVGVRQPGVTKVAKAA